MILIEASLVFILSTEKRIFYFTRSKRATFLCSGGFFGEGGLPDRDVCHEEVRDSAFPQRCLLHVSKSN